MTRILHLVAPAAAGVDAVVRLEELGMPCLKRVLGRHGANALVGMTGAESVGRINAAIVGLPDACDGTWFGFVVERARGDLERLKVVATLGPDSVWAEA